jgi:cell division protein FtsW
MELTGRYAAAPAVQAELDRTLFWSALVLLLYGLVMVYSASIATAEASRFTGHQPQYYLIRHAAYVAIGLAAGVVAFQIPMRAWQQLAPWLFIVGVVLLLAVLLPHVGREINGARRWLPLGPVNAQPSEFMKLFAVLYAADYTVPSGAASCRWRRSCCSSASCCCASRTSAPSW